MTRFIEYSHNQYMIRVNHYRWLELGNIAISYIYLQSYGGFQVILNNRRFPTTVWLMFRSRGLLGKWLRCLSVTEMLALTEIWESRRKEKGHRNIEIVYERNIWKKELFYRGLALNYEQKMIALVFTPSYPTPGAVSCTYASTWESALFTDLMRMHTNEPPGHWGQRLLISTMSYGILLVSKKGVRVLADTGWEASGKVFANNGSSLLFFSLQFPPFVPWNPHHWIPRWWSCFCQHLNLCCCCHL